MRVVVSISAREGFADRSDTYQLVSAGVVFVPVVSKIELQSAPAVLLGGKERERRVWIQNYVAGLRNGLELQPLLFCLLQETGQ